MCIYTYTYTYIYIYTYIHTHIHTNNARVPIGEIIFELFRAIAFGINCNEYGLDFVLSILQSAIVCGERERQRDRVEERVGETRRVRLREKERGTERE